MSRPRRRKPLPGQLRAYWGIDSDGEGPDLILNWGEGCHKGDAHLLHHALNHPRMERDFTPGAKPGSTRYAPSFVEELKARGYDITTLEFRIKKLPTPKENP